ncbi:hypothetical protein, partial [Burkholderia sp. Bp8992]|uniref:hypothetical protein n=1 Tax=Burkholderia sp. Bp8992 TaxID=2184554 RepID=UPI001C89A6C0
PEPFSSIKKRPPSFDGGRFAVFATMRHRTIVHACSFEDTRRTTDPSVRLPCQSRDDNAFVLV